MELAMLENNNNNISPRSVVRGYEANNQSPIKMTSYYDRQLEKTPIDTYEVAGQYALENPEQANQPISLWSDAWKAFNNSRDQINLMSERSIISREINPELEQIESALNNPSDLTDSEIEDLQDRRRELLAERDEINAEIESLHKDIKERDKVSPIYQAMQQQTEEESPSWYSKDYIRYSLPSTMGSSFSTVVQYGTALGGLALRTAAKGLITAAATAGSATSGGALTPLAIASATDTVIAAADLATQWYQRRRESLAQAYGAYKDRLDNDLKKQYGIGLEQYVEEGRTQLMQTMNPNDVQQMQDDEIIDRILTGQIQINDEKLKQLSDAAKHGADVVYNRNMALSIMDMGQTALISNPIARGLRNIISKPIGKLLSPITNLTAPARKKLNKLVDNYIGWNARLNINKPKTAAALKTIKDLSKYGIAAVGEAFEEGAQDVYDADYIKGLYDNESAGFLSSITGLMDANYRVAKILSGIDTESELAKDPQFWNDVKAGFALGMYMGAAPAVANSVVGTAKQLAANSMIRDISIENMQRKDTMEKVKAYADRAAKRRLNYDQEVLDTLEALKRNPSEGLTAEDIDAEINLAKQVFNIVGNSDVRAMAKQAGFEPGSKEFSTYIALAHDAREEVKRSAENVKDMQDKLSATLAELNNDFSSLGLTKENADLERRLTIANGQKAVLEQLQEVIEKDPGALQKFGITSKDHPLAKQLQKEIKAELNRINADTKALTKDTNYSEDFYRNTENAEKAASQYLGLLVSNINHSLVSKEADMMNGVYGTDNGKLKYFRKLDKKDKEKVGNAIKNKVNAYIKNSEETSKVNTAAAEEIAGQQPQSTTTTQESPSNSTKAKSYDDSIPKDDTDAVANKGEGLTDQEPQNQPQPQAQQPQQAQPQEQQQEKQPSVETEVEDITQEELEDVTNAVNRAKEQKQQNAPEVDEIPGNIPQVLPDDIETDNGEIHTPIDEDTERANAALNAEDEYNFITQKDKKENSDIGEEKTIGDKEEEARQKIELEALFQNQDGLNLEDSLVLDGLEISDRISNVLFYSPVSDKPMLPGYKSGKELAALLEKPGELASCSFRFFIDESFTDPNYRNKPYKKGNRSTWDSASIMLEINHPSGKYLVALKTPKSAESINNDKQAIDKLIENRNAIIEALENKNENQEVIPTTVKSSNGVYNQNTRTDQDGIKHPVFRPISEVPTIELNKENFVIGKGTMGNFELFDMFGQTVPGHGGNGQLFYLAKPSQTLSGNRLPIQMNVQRFSNILARALANMLIESTGSVRYLTEDGFIDAKEILDFIVYNGPKTAIKSDDPRLDFLANKQLYFDDQNMLHVGKNSYNTASITEEQMDEIIETLTNMHFSVEKSNFWGSMRNALPSVAEYFDRTSNTEIMVLPGVKFTAEQFNNPDYSVFDWFVDNNLISTDIKDNFFTDAFNYYTGISIVDKVATEPQSIKNASEKVDKISEVEGKSTESIQDSTNATASPTVTEDDYINELLKAAENGIDPLNMFGDTYNSNTNKGQPRKVSKPINENVSNDEVKWFRDKLGLIGENIEFVDQAIALGNDEYAMGLCKLYSTILWTGAERGTLYHEAFHKVSLLLLSPKERQQIYRMYRNRTGFVGTDEAIEELLAEEFRQYMIDRNDHQLNLVKRMFKAIRNFISRWFNRNEYAITNLFNKINKGYYRDKSMNPASVNEWLERFKEDGGAPFKYKGHEFKNVTNVQINEAINSLASAALIFNNVKLIGDVNRIDLTKVKQALDPRVSSTLLSKGTITEQQAAVRTELFENFDSLFKDEIVKYLNNFKIKVSDDPEVIAQENEDKASGNAVGDEMAKHIKESFESSTKDNALTTIKVFIACLPNLQFVNGDPNNVSVVLNQATGLPTTVPFHQAWNTISTELAGCKTFNEMLDKSAELSSQYAVFKALHSELQKLVTPVEGESYASKLAKENFKTQFENTFKKHLADFVYVVVAENNDENGNRQTDILLVNENANKRVKETVAGWLNELIHNTNLVKIDNTGAYVVDDSVLDTITAVTDKFDKLVNPKVIEKVNASNLNSAKNYLLGLLSEIGIHADIDSLNVLLRDNYYSPSDVESFKKLLNDNTPNGVKFLFRNKLKDLKKVDSLGNIESGKFTNPISKFYNRSAFVKKLAETYCIAHPTNDELTVLSTDNKLFYMVTESNYLTDFTSDLNNDSSLVTQLGDVMYVAGDNSNTKNFIKGSHILNNLLKGHKFSVQTLVGFRNSGTDDAGRKYTEISPLENYIMRMALTMSGKLVLPTMGDSGRYDVLSGSAIDNFSNRINVDLDNAKISFGADILRRFINYFETELDTIEYNYNHPPRNAREKIKNYDTGARNGYRFRMFDGVNLMGLTTDKAGKLNETLAEAEKIDNDNNDSNYTEAKNVVKQFRERWNSLSFKEKSDLMDDYLKKVFVERELPYAAELGVIRFNGKKLLSVKNKAIPSRYINEAQKHYSGNYSHQLATLEIMMNYFANTLSSTIEFEKLFVKDPAYYKNPVDKIKRYREVLSTGVKPRTDYDENAEMADLTEFNVATFKDNEIVSRQIDEIKEAATKSFLFKLLENRGLSPSRALEAIENNDPIVQEYEEQARSMAENRFSGYTKTNQTDATVLISPEGYKQLVRRIDGWDANIEKAFNILNNTDILTSDDPSIYQDSLNTLIKPLKVMYFGGTVNSDLKREVPIFDKMALFPVFPAIATGDMKHVLDAMQKQNVHMIAFDSAVKVGQDNVTKMYNDDGSVNIEGINNLTIHKQPLKYFRRQLITDPHDSHHEQMFVSQALKASLLNVRHSGTYTLPDGSKITGEELLKNVTTAIDALTKYGEKDFNNKYGVDTNSDGETVADPIKTADELRRSAERSNMNQNAIDGLTVENGKTKAPLSGLSDNSWMETSLTATIGRDMIDIKTPGGMFIQMSSIMYNDLTVGKSRTLKFDNEDGSLECVISINLLKNLIPDYENKSFKEAKEWLQKAGIIGSDTKALAVGYRIPAQGPSSVAALKVVDVYPENIGDTITLPDEWTALTGSDKTSLFKPV